MHADLHRQVWIEETGVSTVWMDAADIPTWTEQSIRTMASGDNLFGITWWDSHDLNPKLLQSRTSDAAYLAARGIDKLITLDQV